jgi:hypothetical protein
MDEAVLRAIAKWPDVPSAYGWLALDRRGNWLVKGGRIASTAIVAFIGRNYAADAAGRWYFQNGPQRVFVALEYTPYVLRTAPGSGAPGVLAHTGQPVAAVESAWLDDQGAILLGCLGSAGLVDDRDVAGLLPQLRDARGEVLDDHTLEAWLAGAHGDVRLQLSCGEVPVGRILRRDVARRFGFDPAPRPRGGEPEC